MNEATSREPGRLPPPVEHARHRHTHRTPTPSAPASVFVYAWLLAALSVTIFLAAGPVQGSLGIFLACAGMAMTFFPARVRVGWPLWLAVGGLLVCGSLAFLPARWFPAPAWRTALGAAPAIHLPSTVTPVPWETGFWLAVIGLSCLMGLFLLAHPIRSQTMLRLAAAAALVCGGYAALSIYVRQTGWQYPFSGGASFGFFPNRNHTAAFLVTGSIAALGVMTIGLREGRWTISAMVAAATAACVAGLFLYSGSRGGVIFVVVGTLIWVVGLGSAHRNVRLLVSVAALAGAAGVLFLVSGGEARSRLLGTGESNPPARSTNAADAVEHASGDPLSGNQRDTPLDFRILIYRDTLALVKDAPVTGAGLGAFAPVFAQERRASLSAAAPLHPESDWLMLAAEAGVPALAFALLAGGLLASRLRGMRHHPYWPLRWGCAAAAFVAVLHGIVDVPAHRVALGWWILWLASLGTQAVPGRDARASAIQRMLFALGGLGALALGVQLIRAEWFGGTALPPFAAIKAQEKILATFERGDTLLAMQQAQAAVETSPLAAPLYYQWGVLMLRFEDSDAEVDEAFKAQRVLNPTWPTVPLLQGDAWVDYHPKKAAALWLEALDRQARIDHAPRRATPLAVHFYGDLVQRAARWPAIQTELIRAVERGPDYLLAWLENASADAAREQLPGIMAQPALLAALDPAQRERFLVLWYAKGDHTELARFLAENPAWQESSWLVNLHRYVGERQFELAVRTACEHFHVSLALPTQDSPQTDAGLDAGRAARFDADWASGNLVIARRVLEGATGGEDGSPAFTAEDWRLRAALAAYDQDWPRAWESLKNNLHATHPTQALP